LFFQKGHRERKATPKKVLRNWLRLNQCRELEDAARVAYRELVLWMETEYDSERWDAYMILGQCGIVRLGNFVDPKFSVGAAIRKIYLPKPDARATETLRLASAP
jgi:hypothetical protein